MKDATGHNLNQSCMHAGIGKSGHFYLKQEFSSA